MGENFLIRSFQKTDEEEVVKLLIKAFPGWIDFGSPSEHWRWKYRDAPFKPIILVATDGDKIVGVSHDVILNMKVGEKILKTNYGDDLATDPDYRGRGIYRLIARRHIDVLVEEGIGFTYSYPVDLILKSLLKEGRVPFPHKLSHQYRIKDVGLHITMSKQKNHAQVLRLGYTVLKFVNRLQSSFRSPHGLVDFTISDITKFENVDEFWGKVKDSYSFVLERDARFLNWRYCDKRGGDYIVKQASKDGALLGFIVVEVKDVKGYVEGTIVDLICLPGREDVADALMVEACKVCDDRRANMINYRHVKNHPYGKIAYRNGFLDASLFTKLRLIIQCKEGDYEIIKQSHPSKIHLVYGDSF